MKEKVNMQKEKSVIKQNKNYYVINIKQWKNNNNKSKGLQQDKLSINHW